MARSGPGRGGYPEEERVPWLEPAGEAPAARFPVVPVILVLVALVVTAGFGVAGYRWWQNQGIGEGEPGLIKAEPGPYKVKPSDPGGMEVEGEGYASYAASEGADPNARLNLSALPEAPVGKQAGAQPAESNAEAGGGAIQLGAFSSEGKAKIAWKALSTRFQFLAPLTPVVIPAKVEESNATVYRLRAIAGPQAADFCGRLKVAGETCMVVGG